MTQVEHWELFDAAEQAAETIRRRERVLKLAVLAEVKRRRAEAVKRAEIWADAIDVKPERVEYD